MSSECPSFCSRPIKISMGISAHSEASPNGCSSNVDVFKTLDKKKEFSEGTSLLPNRSFDTLYPTLSAYCEKRWYTRISRKIFGECKSAMKKGACTQRHRKLVWQVVWSCFRFYLQWTTTNNTQLFRYIDRYYTVSIVPFSITISRVFRRCENFRWDSYHTTPQKLPIEATYQD